VSAITQPLGASPSICWLGSLAHVDRNDQSISWRVAVTMAVAILIVVGSGNLSHFAAGPVRYTFAVRFAVFAISYRYAMWLQRPSTAFWLSRRQIRFEAGYISQDLDLEQVELGLLSRIRGCSASGAQHPIDTVVP
jgi:hypothetical protein